MMTLLDLYSRLALGELTGLAMSAEGTIAEAKRPSIVLAANEGLKKLYTRYLLKEDDLFIELSGHRTVYPLLKKHALSSEAQAGVPRFINDIGRNFNEDVIRVLSIWNSIGDPVPLNEENRAGSIFTKQPNVLQIPRSIQDQVLSVHYQANHPVLNYADDPADQEIELPEFMLKALTSFIASEIFGHMNTVETTNKSLEHLKKFETICVEVIEQDLVTTGSTDSGDRFEKNGWI